MGKIASSLPGTNVLLAQVCRSDSAEQRRAQEDASAIHHDRAIVFVEARRSVQPPVSGTQMVCTSMTSGCVLLQDVRFDGAEALACKDPVAQQTEIDDTDVV